jgi:hypothetical protein
MAITAQYSNVIVLADADTFTGPMVIRSARVVGASSTADLTTDETVKILDIVEADHTCSELDIRIASGTTITANLTGTGAKLYLYLK